MPFETPYATHDAFSHETLSGIARPRISYQLYAREIANPTPPAMEG